MTNLDPGIQKIVKIVERREGVPLCLEEAEVEDASKIEIDWPINIEGLEITRGEDKSVTVGNFSIGSFRN